MNIYAAIHIDTDKIKAAARTLYEKDDRYGTGEEMPSLAVYEAAVEKWLENAADSIADEPVYFAYGANRILSYSTWDRALEWAEHQSRVTP